MTLSPTPCGLSDTGPGSSGSVPSAYCVASWSSSVGYPSVIPSFLPSPLLFVVLVRSGCWCVGEVLSVYTRASAATGQPKTASTAVGPSAVGRRSQFDVGHNGRQCGGEAASDCAVPSPPAAAHSSRLARKPGSRLRTGAALVTVASSRSNCSSDGKMLFLHLLALRGTLEEGRPPKKHDPHPIPYPSYLTTRRLIGYPGRQWVSGYP